MTLITFNKIDLLHALAELSTVVPKKSADYPVCKFVAVTFKDDTVVLTGTNSRIQVSIKVDAKYIKTPNNFLFHFDKVYTILKRCKDTNKITFDLQYENQIAVLLDNLNARYKINNMSYDKFIWLQSEKLDYIKTLRCATIFSSLSKVLHATTCDPMSKPVLRGVHIMVGMSGMAVAATDGHRLAAFRSADENLQEKDNKRVVIPVDAGQMVTKICANYQDADVTIGFNQSTFKAVVDRVQVVFRLQDAIYPELIKTIPKDTEHCVSINRQELLNALKTLNTIVLDDKFKRCTLDFAKNSLLLSATNTMKETGEVGFEVEGIDVDMSISLNHTFILDAVSSFEGENILVAFSDPMKAVKLSEGNDNMQVNVIMPLR